MTESRSVDKLVEPTPWPLPSRLSALVALCSLAYFFDALSQAILGPLAPAISVSLGLNAAQLGPIFSASLVGQSIGLMFVSMLPSRFGYRPVLIGCLIAYGLAEIAAGFAGTGNQLLVLRLLTGIGIGGSLPVCIALASDHAPAQRRGLAVSIITFAYAFGGLCSGFVAAPFQGAGEWRYVLVAIGGCSVASGLLCLAALEESPAFAPGTHAQATDKGRQQDRPSAVPWRLFSRGMVLGTLMLWLVFIGLLIVQTCILSWLPTLLVGLGRDASLAALVVSAYATGGMVGMLALGFLVDRFGTVRVMNTFLLAAVLMIFLFGRFLADFNDVALLGMAFLVGFTLLGAYGGSNVILSDYYPGSLRSIGIGWAKSASRIGAIVAPALVGFALSWGISEQQIVTTLAVPPLAVALAVTIIGVILRGRQEEERRHITAEPANRVSG